MKNLRKVIVAILVGSFFVGSAFAATQGDVGSSSVPPVNTMRAPTSQSDIDNGDGTFTFTQVVDENSTAPHYIQPASGGFEIYSWFDEDYGWMHNFTHWNEPGLTILSATMTIVGWDIDSNVEDGEFDGVHIDGVLLDPGYLQGYDGEWSVTVFDLRTSDITDDGILNVWLDIDMTHTEDWWATTLDYSEIQIVYSTTIVNQPPFQPVVEISPACPSGQEDLVATVLGPTPADPDGDAVTYVYRWFVDITDDGVAGPFIDDEFAGRPNHTGNVVPAADTMINDLWRVQVTPVDSYGAIGEYTTVTWGMMVGCYPISTESISLDSVKTLYR